MDILTTKSKKDYNYTSRYSPFFYYYNSEDKKYVYGITSQLDLGSEYSIHNVVQGDTLDSLALKYYGRPDLYWVIADFNRIQDSYINLFESYNYLYIPNLTTVRYIS